MNSINNQISLYNKMNPGAKIDYATSEMTEIAHQEALQRTWQDDNKFTQAISTVQKWLNKNVGTKDSQYGLGNVIFEFTKTPANLIKATIDYSPIGLIKSLAVDARKLNASIADGTVTAKQQKAYVDAISKGIAGTFVMIAGGALAKAGVVSGGADKDKDVENFKNNILGIQPYSVQVGDSSYTYDWAQPVMTGFAIGADIATNNVGVTNVLDLLVNSVSTAGGLIYKQSLLQGVYNFFKAADPVTGIIEAAANSTTKFFPTIINQFSQILDSTQRDTYDYNSLLKTVWNKIVARTPFSYTLPAKYDVLGREVKYNNNPLNVLANPSNIKTQNINTAAVEIWKQYQKTGDASIIPRVAPYYVTDDAGNRKVMSTADRSEYQRQTGQGVSNSIASLVVNDAYNGRSAKDKNSVIGNLLTYHAAIAKHTYLTKIGAQSELSSENKSVLYSTWLGVDDATYINFRSMAGKFESELDKNGEPISGSIKKQVVNNVNSLNLSKMQRLYLIKSYGGYSIGADQDAQLVEYIGSLGINKSQMQEIFAKLKYKVVIN